MDDDRRNRHWDTLCVSVMTLATAIIAGLFVFLRFPEWETTTIEGLGFPEIAILVGVAAAVLIYTGCIWLGMAVLANENTHIKAFVSRYLRFSVLGLTLLVIVVVAGGILTHLELGPSPAGTEGDTKQEPTTRALIQAVNHPVAQQHHAQDHVKVQAVGA